MTMLAVLGIVIAVVVIAAVVRHARRSARTGNRLSSAWAGSCTSFPETGQRRRATSGTHVSLASGVIEQ